MRSVQRRDEIPSNSVGRGSARSNGPARLAEGSPRRTEGVTEICNKLRICDQMQIPPSELENAGASVGMT